jgi:two-component system sensor histidine kinase/response regulator
MPAWNNSCALGACVQQPLLRTSLQVHPHSDHLNDPFDSMKLPMQARYSLTILSVVVFVVVSSAVTLHLVNREPHQQLTEAGINTMTDELVLQMKRHGNSTASLLAKAIAAPLAIDDITGINAIVHDIRARQDIIEIDIFDYDGVIVHDGTHANERAGELLVSSVEIGRLFTDGLGITKVGGTLVTVTRPIIYHGVSLGGLRLGFSRMHIANATARLNSEERMIAQGRFRQSAIVLVLITAFWALAGIGGAIVVSRRLINPIGVLSNYAQAVGRGVYDLKLATTRDDEIGDLMEDFRVMAENLKRTTVSLDYFEGVVGNMSEALIVLSPHGEIRSVNTAARRLLKYDDGELVGQQFEIILTEDEAPRTRERILKIVRVGSMTGCDDVLVARDGEPIPVSFSATLMRDHGHLTGIICTARDEREIQLSRSQLQDALAAAEKANSARSNFLTRMSHELRTPLNGVLGMTDLLLSTGLNNQQHHYSQSIRNSGQRLMDMISEVLDFSRMETGKLELANEPFDVADLVEGLVESIAPRAHGKGLELLCDIHGDVPAVQSDPNRLRQILVNLIENALKFTGTGEVCVAVEVEEREGQGAGLVFRVTDTGIGIDPADHGRVFELFSQVDDSSTRAQSGTGLGLAICRELVGMMGGRIGVDSEFGAGASFWFTVNVEVVENCTGALHPDLNLADVTVLGIDPGGTSQRIIDRYVSGLGASYQGVTDIHDAVVISDPVLYDIVMMDQRLLMQHRKMLPTLKKLGRRLVVLAAEETSAEFAVEVISKPLRRIALHKCLLGESVGRFDEPLTASPEFVRLEAEILVAEDNRINQEFIKTLLVMHGCKVDVADNGAQAVVAVEKKRYDIVFMDCQMPEMDGCEATRRIRELEALSAAGSGRTTIIALTANSMSGDREECLNAGMDDYLAKPFSREQLSLLLQHWLQDRQAEMPSPFDSTHNTNQKSGDALIDISVLNELRLLEQAGATGLFEDVVSMYLHDSAGFMSSLNSALEDADTDAIRQNAHALKSCSGNVGAMGIMSLSAALEAQAKRDALTNADDLMSQLEQMYDEVCVALASELQGLPAA